MKMQERENFGDYSKTFITAVPADLKSEEALFFDERIPKFADEAVYIYSFKQNRMIYASGWEEVLGYLRKLSLSRQVVLSTSDTKLWQKLAANGWQKLVV